MSAAFRPEHVEIGETAQLAGTIDVIENLGHETYVFVDTADGRVCVVVDRALRPRTGEAVRLVECGRSTCTCSMPRPACGLRVTAAAMNPPAAQSRPLVDWLNANFKHWSLLPAVVVFVALTRYPIVNLLRMSVSTIEFRGRHASSGRSPGPQLGRAPDRPGLGPTVVNTLIFVVAAVIVEMVLGLALALLVGGMTRGKGLMRTIMIIPILVPPVAIGSMFKLMYQLRLRAVQPDRWAWSDWVPSAGSARPSLALWSVVLVDIWHWVPFVFLILFAAVEGLPKEVLEAGRVDGATRWQLLWRVTLPLLMPAITVAFLFRAILAFKAFDEVFLLTGGGPGTSSELLSLHLYKVFFEQNQLGYGAMLSVFTIVGVLMLLAAAGSSWPRAPMSTDRRIAVDVIRRGVLDARACARASSAGSCRLAIVLVVGPFLWILMNSFKTQIAILSGAWIFTPTLDSYEDVLFSRRSDFVNGLYTSLIVATVSTAIVLVIGTLARLLAASLSLGALGRGGLLGWMLAFHVIPVSRWSGRGTSCSRNWGCTTRARR